MSAPMIFAPEYYERMRALESGSWWNAGMRDLARRLLQLAPLPAGGLAIDVGCGSGQTMRWFREMWPGWRTTGIDISRDGVRAARAGGGEQVAGGSALELPFADGVADLVMTVDMLQHLPLEDGDALALAEMRRVLRPGGVLFVRTNAQSVPRIPDDSAHQFRKYSAAELKARLQHAGFVVRRLGRVNALLGIAEIPRELRARRRSGGGYAGLLAEVPRQGAAWRAKRAWLGLESALIAAGFSLPLGRTLVALAQVPTEEGIA